MSHKQQRLVTCPYCSGEFTPGAKIRSPQHHRRFFAMIRVVFDNWPASHKKQFKSAKALRKWLTAKAKYVDVITIDPPPGLTSDDLKMRLSASVWMHNTIHQFRKLHEYSWVESDGDAMLIYVPQSIAFDRMTQSEFTDLTSAVKNIIWQETGLDPEALLEGKSCSVAPA